MLLPSFSRGAVRPRQCRSIRHFESRSSKGALIAWVRLLELQI